ncbi:D-alanyl-D-alanine carboxypeptidase family protein [uncultured Tateyamaria sp.]|uniref:D-alanyl-D-alanine carboxypeptidase family protein n=1 Tax=uncultured Tateyamaria sp. TaxID=455651 RepID=UPI0026291092|nr:D-alanyl-D-alanine carboxypeptidase family protein [uncultured Tateyamaria sp.]
MIRPIAVAALLIASTALPVTAFETRASAAYVVDHTTGTVLLNKNADDPLPPASMSKLMTLYMAFEAIERGQLSMTDELVVSAHANSFGGSTLFLKQGERVTVEDLIRGIIVLSGNDACVVIAETLSPDGTEAGFARLMTRRAQEMGMTNSTFANSSGWPAAGHLMSMRDLGLLSQRLIADYPEYYPMFSETEFLFDEEESSNRYNRNPLLTLGIGADGLKTGHTQEAGYGLTGSAKQGDRRVVFVISGLDTAAGRAQESEAIVNWAFRQFAERTVVEGGSRVATARVWEGAEPEVGLVPQEDVTILLPILAGKTVDAEVVYTGPIQAPISEGTELAELVIQPEGLPEVRIPLVAEADVAHGGFLAKLSTAALSLIERMNSGNTAEGDV